MSLDPTRLWAKSWRKGDPFSESMRLPQHLQDVYTAAERILDATAVNQLSALGLDPKDYGDRFRRCVLLAAAVHDLGKANDHFQGMLLWSPDRRDKPQGIRHEWVTVLMLQELKAWLLPAVGGNETDYAFVEWAVAGHHPAHNHDSPPSLLPAGAGPDMRIDTGHMDFRDIMAWVTSTFSLNPMQQMESKQIDLIRTLNSFKSNWRKDAIRRWDKFMRLPDARLLAAIKNTLIAADVAGSALPRDGTPNWGKITTAFNSVPPAADLEFLAHYGLEGYDPRPFQTAVAEHPDDVVFVKAGCGTGKTVAAYMRAAKRWAGRRLYFCYPTTGTATEGFKDYLFPEQPGKPSDDTAEKCADSADRERLKAINADLFHSRSGVDFEIILTTGGDSKSADSDAAAKADALAMWSTPVVACTVDTVLGIVQNNRKGLFAWPALAQSAFVFDEIHAYDDRLFGALLRFLRDVPGLPCLLMTASLPTPREEALKEVLKKFRNITLTPITGPEELEKMPRYHKVADDGKHLDLIADEVKRGGKVLWVSNTVNRVMTSADAAQAVGLTPLIYHSRFKYGDRVQRHKAVIDAFDPKVKVGVLACTSQVCEMSLDLKGCTLLVTEAAPVPALIQRLGRLNRHAKPPKMESDPPPPTMPFIVLKLGVKDYPPYESSELDSAAMWLGKISDTDISQRALAEKWEQTGENPPDLVPSAWLDGGPITTVSELRKASPGVTVLMAGDLTKLRKAIDLGKYTLPMPPPPKAVDWRTTKHKGIPVVADDTINYDEQRGAAWRK